MTFIPDWPVLLKYTVAAVGLFVIPGPDMSLCLSKTLTEGRRAAFYAMAGVFLGCFAHTLLAALGVSALLVASPSAFTALKIGGALYLLWLAVSVIRHGSALKLDMTADAKPTGMQNFFIGLGINLANPKIVLFFLTFLPQFVTASDPHAPGKLAFLGLYFIILSAPLMTLVIFSADRLTGRLKNDPKIMRRLDYGFAAIFGLFAISVLATSASTPPDGRGLEGAGNQPIHRSADDSRRE